MKRSWAVQERSLSVQTLHFAAEQLYREFTSLVAREVFLKSFVNGTTRKPPKIFLYSRTEEYVGSREKRLKKAEELREMSKTPSPSKGWSDDEFSDDDLFDWESRCLGSGQLWILVLSRLSLKPLI